LTRIFRIVDKDCDNFITDDELNYLQLEVFKGELTQEDIRGIKDVIKDEVLISCGSSSKGDLGKE